MLNTKTTLSIKIGERTYEFSCDPMAPLGEIHDCLSKFKSYVVERITEAHAKDQPSNPPQPPKVSNE